MPEFKEKPKMKQPKARRTAMPDVRQRAARLKEKYQQEQMKKSEPQTAGSETEAVEEVECAGAWAVDTLADHVPHPFRKRQEQFREKRFGPETEKTPIQPGSVHQTAENGGSRQGCSRSTSSSHYASDPIASEKAEPINDPRTQQFESRRQYVADKHRRRLTTDRQIMPDSSAQMPYPSQQAERHAPYGADMERRRPRIKDRSKSAAGKKPVSAPKVRRSYFKPPKKKAPSVSTSQEQARTLARTKQTAKKAALTVKKAAAVIRRAVTALTAGIAGLFGGAAVLVALIIVIVIAAVASSPFGLFFAAERNAPDTVSVAEAVAQVNVAYNARLEELQSGDYDSIQIQGQAADWPEVLAVFAAKTAGADDGTDVATLDAERVSRLTAVFWDMTVITSRVEPIYHPGGEDEEGWTEYILHITITPKTADDMRTAYGFTQYQNDALDALLADRAALVSLAASLTITNADAVDVLQNLPADLSAERRAVVQNALTLYGKVSYFWGGKSGVIGWDSRWGTLTQVTAAGSPTTGTYRPYGLDCSGFVDWVFNNAHGYIIGHGGGAHAQHTYCTDISWEDAQPGDLVFYPADEHVGIVCGWGGDGSPLVIHCASGANNVVITGTGGFTSIARPDYYGE